MENDSQADVSETGSVDKDVSAESGSGRYGDSDVRNEEDSSDGQFKMRPHVRDRFRPGAVKDVIHGVLREELAGKVYAETDPSLLSSSIAQRVKRKVMELGFPRYKYVVQVILGEQLGAGVRTGTRCLWDADCDNYASDVYIGDSIFCMAVVFAFFAY
ncbi:dynein light chain Tctex-type protein 2B-like [Ischnura elegans]|uniref:dynein light chain Tctex-type protein 2B-like n=1 Tax=Ischnura elegans TaxID=197161 RepID=UPI001ED8B55D|nr:dynein light chain Tctex-type protein 2B-like [Ischnura elegans]